MNMERVPQLNESKKEEKNYEKQKCKKNSFCNDGRRFDYGAFDRMRRQW